MSDDTDIDYDKLIPPRFAKRAAPVHTPPAAPDKPEAAEPPAKAAAKPVAKQRPAKKQGSRAASKPDTADKGGRRIQLAFYGDRADTITTAHVDWISRHPESLLRLGALPTMNAFLCAALEAGLAAADKDPDLILDRLPQRGSQL